MALLLKRAHVCVYKHMILIYYCYVKHNMDLMYMSSKLQDSVKTMAYMNGSSVVITVPALWKGLIGMKSTTGENDLNVTMDLMHGKHGHFIAVYGKFQKK